MKELETLKQLLEIDSPSGYTHEACEYIHKLLSTYGWQPRYTNKGVVAPLAKTPPLP